MTGVGTTRRMRHRVEVHGMSHHAESRGHVATMLCLRYTRVEERYRLMRIVKGGEKENRRYSNRDVRKGSWYAASSGVSEPLVEVRGSRQSPGSRALCHAGLELRPLPSTGITRRRRYCEPVRHPEPPGLSLAGVRLEVTRLHRSGLPVLRRISSTDMPSPIPRWDHWFESLRGV